MGYDRAWGWSSKDWSQEESRGPNPPQKSARLRYVSPELFLSAAHLLHLSGAGFLLTAGGAIRLEVGGVGERGG